MSTPAERARPVPPPRRPSPARVAVVYLVVSVGWILLSDRALARLGVPADDISWAQSVKGVGFVTLTAALLYWLVGREVRAATRLQDLLRAVVEGTPDAVYAKDRDGKYLMVNESAARFVGKPVAGVVGRDDTSVFDPAGAAAVAASDRRVMETGRPETEEMVLTAAGVTRAYLSTKMPYRDGAGNVIGVLGQARDITDRKRAEEALRAAQQRLQDVVTSSPAVLFTLAIADGQIRGINWVSDNLGELLGHTPAEATAPGWWPENIHPDDRDQVVARLHEELFTAGRTTQEYRFRTRTGGYRWTRNDIRLARDVAGRAAEAVGSWADVTDRRRLEEQFRQAQKLEAVGTLAGGVAHDFNNLLTVINGHAELLLAAARPDDPAGLALAAIKDAGERAAQLTSQLLAFSRRAIIEPRVLDPNEVVGRAAGLLGRLIGDDVILSTNLDPAAGRFKADPGQVEQALMNLAVNALDAMPTGGRLTISTRVVEVRADDPGADPDVYPGRYVVLEVADTGCGMTDEVKARVFEPFFTTKEVGKGTGLGLAMVYGVAKTYGGHVEVESRVGVGSTFRVFFPAEADAANRPSGSIQAPPPRGSETILLVEDDGPVRDLARLALQRQGYTVLEAGGAAEAVRVAEAHPGPVHLLVTDVVMPGGGGREVAEGLRGRYPGLKVLFISGYTDDAVVRHGVGEGTAGFLRKPFTPATLARKVREVLDDPDGGSAADPAER